MGRQSLPHEDPRYAGQTIATGWHDCAYFRDGRDAAEEIVLLNPALASLAHVYFEHGYRRLGNFYYRPACPQCSDCVPVRVDVRRFAPSRSQRRTLRRNRDVIVSITEPHLTANMLDIYRRYQEFKHDDTVGELEHEQSLAMLHFGYDRIVQMEYYLENRLVGVGVVDEAENALSSVYFYYDPEILPRRPGIYSMLREIELAAIMGKQYHYLGYYVRENKKMEYKKEFHPQQWLESPSNIWIERDEKGEKGEG